MTTSNTATISGQYISYSPQTNITGQTTYPYQGLTTTAYNGTTTYPYIYTNPYGTITTPIQQTFQYDGYSNIYICACGLYHTELFNYLSILETEEEFRALFKKVIRMHYKAEDNTNLPLQGFNPYYADIVSLQTYVKVHFDKYIELLDAYLLLK